MKRQELLSMTFKKGDSTLCKILFMATGEYRAPKKGEWYLSGAIIEAYQAANNFRDTDRFHIAKIVKRPPEEITLNGFKYKLNI